MHAKPSLNRIINAKSRRPSRSSYHTNSPVVMIGDWRLEEDAQGNLVATNTETGSFRIIATK